jgi:hypothetical protein
VVTIRGFFKGCQNVVNYQAIVANRHLIEISKC